jgi:hypothetical protein
MRAMLPESPEKIMATRITKKLKTEYVRNKLASDQKWALRSLVIIMGFQTDDEQMTGHAYHDNNEGFTGADSEFMTSLATQYKSRGSLSPKQIVHVMKKMKKYSRQVMTVIDEKKLVTCMQRDGILTQQDVAAFEANQFLEKL